MLVAARAGILVACIALPPAFSCWEECQALHKANEKGVVKTAVPIVFPKVAKELCSEAAKLKLSAYESKLVNTACDPTPWIRLLLTAQSQEKFSKDKRDKYKVREEISRQVISLLVVGIPLSLIIAPLQKSTAIPTLLATGVLSVLYFWSSSWGGKRVAYNNGANGWKSLQGRIVDALERGADEKMLAVFQQQRDQVFNEQQNESWNTAHTASLQQLLHVINPKA